jgi:hypothetical protein
MNPDPPTPPVYSHPFTLILHTSNPTPPTITDAFGLVTAHRIKGATPALVVDAQTLSGTLRAVSVHASEGQAKRQDSDCPPRPKRREYKDTIRTLLALIHCEDELDMDDVERAIRQAKRLLKK